MKVVVYYRRHPNDECAERDLAIQRDVVAAWLAEKGGEILSEFVEIETNNRRRRPSFAAAQKEAEGAKAKLLVATTKPINGGRRFAPTHAGWANVVCLEDPEEVAARASRRAWESSKALVVYLRSANNGTRHDDLMLAKQRRAAEALVKEGHTLVAEFIEHESGGEGAAMERPAFQAALNECRSQQARLFIGTTDAVGQGKPFHPACEKVPFLVAEREEEEWPEVIEVDKAPAPLCLFFGGPVVRGRRPVYLVNRTGQDLVKAAVNSFGWMMLDGELIKSEPSNKVLDKVRQGTGKMFEAYSIWDDEFVVDYEVNAAAADGESQQAVGQTFHTPPRNGWLPLKPKG